MKIADRSTPVLVMHLHHGALGIARSLGRLGVPVYGMGNDEEGAVSSSRYFEEIFPWDFSETSDERSLEEIFRIGARIGGGRPILVPASDHLVLLLAEHRERLARRFRFDTIPPDLVRSMIDKKDLFFLARRHGIPTPDTHFPTSEEDVRDYATSARFPLMLKGIDGTRLQSRTGRKMMRVDGPEPLLAAYRELEDPSSPNLMIQEYIPGGDDSVWMFNGYFDEQSECRMGFTGRKLHQFPPYKGATSLGVVVSNSTVRELTLRFARAIGYRGILDIGFRYDERDGRYKLLDPNPRIGCTFRLFVGQDGLDVMRAQYLSLTGQSIPDSTGVDGRKWMVESWEIDSVRAYRRDGRLGLRQWIQDVRGVRELAWFAFDDPRPFFRMARGLGGRFIRWIPKKVFRRDLGEMSGTPKAAIR